jgi:hypothetical protein
MKYLYCLIIAALVSCSGLSPDMVEVVIIVDEERDAKIFADGQLLTIIGTFYMDHRDTVSCVDGAELVAHAYRNTAAMHVRTEVARAGLIWEVD